MHEMQQSGRHGAGHRPSGRARRTGRRSAAGLAAAGLVGGLLAATAPAFAATVTGTLLTSGLTRPGGGVWLPGNGGNFWVSDGVLGLCETVPATGGTTKCNGTAKGGQVVYDPVKSLVYQTDGSTKTTQVLRYPYSATSDSLNGSTVLSVPNVTSVGGGAGGGRTQAVALTTGPDGVERLYVGYIKSGDIVQVLNPSGKDKTGATVAPAVSRVGTTSDGRGVNAFSVFAWTDSAGALHHDLYAAETGGAGLSVIKDIDGTGGRPPCAAASLCAAATVQNASGGPVFSFPMGLDNDGKQIYVGSSPPTGPGSVSIWNPITGDQSTLSTDITPSYTETLAGSTQTFTQYRNLTGLAINPATLDVYVGDDPAAKLATPVNAQGHLWKIAGSATSPAVSGVSPTSGPVGGGTTVTISGTNLFNSIAGASDPVAFGTKVKFGAVAATSVTCDAAAGRCTATSPAVAGAGTVDIRVTNSEGQTSALTASDRFTYEAPAANPGAPTITAVTPGTGVSSGGTSVQITGSALVNPDGTSSISFGADPAASATCTPDGLSCTAISPPGTNGTTVDIQAKTAEGTSPVSSSDKFTYVTPNGKLFSYGITAPKGGVQWIPDGTTAGGHFWVSDHANGVCRLDAVPGTKIVAPNVAVCDPGFTVGSPGQAVYDSRVNADGTHYLYVPDNAVRSPGVWRLTFHPSTATIDTPTSMAPGLIDNLKANGLALDEGNDALYVGDLVDGNIRRINKVSGDPRLQTVDIVATTQAQKVGAASRGINGTMAMIGTRVFLPENNAATYFDTSASCAAVGTTTPCSTTTINFLPTPAPVFVAGVAGDAKRNLLYISESPGTANATIYRFDPATITGANPGGTVGAVYVTGGTMPTLGTNEATVYCSLTCTRPADPALTPGGTAGFPFAQGVYVDVTSGDLYVTEDVTAGARSGRGHVWQVPFVP